MLKFLFSSVLRKLFKLDSILLCSSKIDDKDRQALCFYVAYTEMNGDRS